MFNLISNCCNWVAKIQEPIRYKECISEELFLKVKYRGVKLVLVRAAQPDLRKAILKQGQKKQTLTSNK